MKRIWHQQISIKENNKEHSLSRRKIILGRSPEIKKKNEEKGNVKI